MNVGFWQQLQVENRVWANSSNRLGFISKPWFVFPQGGGPRGSYESLADIKTSIRSRDVIVIGGVLREQFVAPREVYDVTIIGAANLPRQALTATGGDPHNGTVTGGGASWNPPHTGAVASTPLLELVASGWSISGIAFTPHTGSAAIRLSRSASIDTLDASHTNIQGCVFASNGGTTQIGVEDAGGSGFVHIVGNRFEGLTTAIKGLSTGAAVPQQWLIDSNVFEGNTNAIGMSLTKGVVSNNVIRQTPDDTNFKVNLVAVSAQGSLNMVIYNVFSDAAANVTISKGYKPGTTDVWRNYVTDTAAYIVTVPA